MSLYENLPEARVSHDSSKKEDVTEGSWTNISTIVAKETEKKISASITSLAPIHVLSTKRINSMAPQLSRIPISKSHQIKTHIDEKISMPEEISNLKEQHDVSCTIPYFQHS
jgi:hypothetical protein